MTTIGMLAKLWAFSVIKANWKPSPLHTLTLVLVSILLSQSIIEFCSYLPALFQYEVNLHALMTGYYICIMFTISLLPFLALKLTQRAIPFYFLVPVVTANIVVLALFISTDLVIEGITPMGVTITAIKGPYYPLFALLVTVCLGTFLYFLLQRNSKTSKFTAIRAHNIYLSCLPFIVFSLIVLAFKQLDIKINALGVLPICFAIFMGAIANNVCKQRIVDYRFYIPFSKKRRQINSILEPFKVLNEDDLTPQMTKKYNQILAVHALELFDGNQTRAAKWLSVSQSWVSRHLKEAEMSKSKSAS